MFADATHGAQGDASAVTNVDADKLAREVVHNELNAQDRDKSLWSYREVQQEKGKTELIAVVQTRDGEIHRLLAVNGMPLNPKQKQLEDQRIAKLLANPDKLRAKQKNQAHDAQQERKLFQMLPDAFHYEYGGTASGLIRLTFKPKPSFHSTDRESAVFHHMAGTLWIAPQEKRLAGINGRLLTGVKFGGGLLGHLDQGGTFSVKQEDVGTGHWEMTLLDVHMNGKALLFKTIAVREKEVYSNFRPVPTNTTAKEAVRLLEGIN